MPSLKDIVVVPQSGGRDLRRLRIVWLHILQCQKVGVQQVWMIHPSCLLEYRQAFFQCSRSLRILNYQARSNQWSSQVIYVLFPAWLSFFQSFHIPHQCQQEAYVQSSKQKLNTNSSTEDELVGLSKRARPDIQISVSFLCTRMKGPDTDDYKNLSRVMKYIQGSIGLPLVLSIYKSGNIKWYIDASLTVHKDIRTHTGGFMTIVTGGAYVQSIKQKLNTNSSTEAELVGIDDVLTQVIWTRYFLK